MKQSNGLRAWLWNVGDGLRSSKNASAPPSTATHILVFRWARTGLNSSSPPQNYKMVTVLEMTLYRLAKHG